MTDQHFYSAEQLLRLNNVHKIICEIRDIDPKSVVGRELAARLFKECDGNERQEDIIHRFTHGSTAWRRLRTARLN